MFLIYYLFQRILLLWISLPQKFVTSQPPPNFNFDSTCSSIASSLSLPNTTVFFSSLLPAGSNITFPDSDPTCQAPGSSQIVPADTCRITMFVATSDVSGIHMEAWLPRNWTGRFLSTGNGGLGGCIQYADMAYGSALGFATVGANNGHNGTSGAAFLNAPEVLADFVFRSVHTNVLVGKELTRQFFGVPHTKSYYLGCSTGGRQGLKSVQEFPEDFDGVVAGAAAADHNHLQAWSGNFFSLTGPPDSPSFLTIDQWVNVIHPDVLNQCDEIDGVKDGIIEVPDLCSYDPSGLICQDGRQNASCITAEQAKTVEEVYKPFFIFGKFAFPRFQFGAEGAQSSLLFGGQMSPFPADWARFVTFSDPNFNVSTLNDHDWALMQKEDNFTISTWKGDISAFKDRNGKLLTYHGQADQLISPINSERYYERVRRIMNLSLEEQDTFYRFFRISGMNHCAGGPGPWEVGQTLDGAADNVTMGSLSLDPERNVLMAMVRWVEEGVPPDTFLGTKFVNDDPKEGVQFSRRHCKFPLKTTFDGIGDPTEPESWSCQ